MSTNVEVEVKIAVRNAAQIKALLTKNGFRIKVPRVLEQNFVLDDRKRRLYTSGLVLRVRRAGKSVTCTFKGVEATGTGPHKRRVEREFTASSFEECLAVFEGLGFSQSFRYDKYRTEFARRGEPGVVTVDVTPVGVFMELEGPSRWIDATAKRLGYSRADYITLGYARLWRQWCESLQKGKRRMATLPDMVFDKP